MQVGWSFCVLPPPSEASHFWISLFQLLVRDAGQTTQHLRKIFASSIVCRKAIVVSDFPRPMSSARRTPEYAVDGAACASCVGVVGEGGGFAFWPEVVPKNVRYRKWSASIWCGRRLAARAGSTGTESSAVPRTSGGSGTGRVKLETPSCRGARSTSVVAALDTPSVVGLVKAVELRAAPPSCFIASSEEVVAELACIPSKAEASTAASSLCGKLNANFSTATSWSLTSLAAAVFSVPSVATAQLHCSSCAACAAGRGRPATSTPASVSISISVGAASSFRFFNNGNRTRRGAAVPSARSCSSARFCSTSALPGAFFVPPRLRVDTAAAGRFRFTAGRGSLLPSIARTPPPPPPVPGSGSARKSCPLRYSASDISSPSSRNMPEW
mmetsp:Transcript_19126/g.47817  ORF Transcript_19126/g.47817 Transcript_19126/m.47817 type:complete len:385 (+) Transcript_19126:2301-3455(+)